MFRSVLLRVGDSKENLLQSLGNEFVQLHQRTPLKGLMYLPTPLFVVSSVLFYPLRGSPAQDPRHLNWIPRLVPPSAMALLVQFVRDGLEGKPIGLECLHGRQQIAVGF